MRDRTKKIISQRIRGDYTHGTVKEPAVVISDSRLACSESCASTCCNLIATSLKGSVITSRVEIAFITFAQLLAAVDEVAAEGGVGSERRDRRVLVAILTMGPKKYTLEKMGP